MPRAQLAHLWTLLHIMTAGIKRFFVQATTLTDHGRPASERRHQGSRNARIDSADRLARRLELFLPVVLAVHGAILLLSYGSAFWHWLVLEVLTAAGATGLLFSSRESRRSQRRRAIRLRATVVVLCTGLLITTSGGTSSPFVLWLFVIVSVYPLLLSRRSSVALLAVVTAGYVALTPISPSAAPLVEILSRAALLLFMGVLIHNMAGRFRSYDYVRRLANVDELTRVHNRRHFFERGRQEFVASRKLDSSATVVMFDLNGFKQINDTHGHAVGDQCLRRFARHLKNTAREGDIVARLGGDEFVVMLTDTGVRGAAELIRRLRTTLDDDPVMHGNVQVPIRSSAGVATLSSSVSSLEDLLERADRDLYRVKERSAKRDPAKAQSHLRVA